MFPKLVKDLAYSIYLLLVYLLSINKDFVQTYNNKNVKLFSKNLIDVTLKTGCSIKESKKHDLVFKMAILNIKSYLLFIIFSNFHPLLDIGQV